MPNILLDSKTGLYFRPDTYDLSVAKEVSSYRMLRPASGGVLLDIGGNIGCVSRWWLRNGGTKAIAVEPEPENLSLLRKNLAEFGDRAVVVPAAAVAVGAPSEISFFLNSGVNKGSHTIRPTRGRREIRVKATPFAGLLEKYRPTALKMDIEGGEFELRKEILSLPDNIKRFAIEWHLTAKGARPAAIDMHDQLIRGGWRWVHKSGGNMNTKTWHVTYTYARD